MSLRDELRRYEDDEQARAVSGYRPARVTPAHRMAAVLALVGLVCLLAYIHAPNHALALIGVMAWFTAIVLALGSGE